MNKQIAWAFLGLLSFFSLSTFCFDIFGGEPVAIFIGVDSEEAFRSSKEARNLLQTLAQCGFSEDRMILLTSDSETEEGKPTFTNIETQFDRLASLTESEDDLVLAVWIGPCCSVSKELFFCPEGNSYSSHRSMVFIDDQLKKFSTKRLMLIIDSFFPRDISDRMLSLSVANIDRTSIPRNAVLFMNDSILPEGVLPPYKSLSGYFSDVLKKGDADLNDDGQTEIRELLRYFEVHRERLAFKGFRPGGEWENEHFAVRFAPRETVPTLPVIVESPLDIPSKPSNIPFEEERTISAYPDHAVVSLAFFQRETQTFLISGGTDRMIKVHQLSDMKCVFEKNLFNDITFLAVNNSGTQCLVATRDMQVELWDIKNNPNPEDNENDTELMIEKKHVFNQLQNIHPEKQGTVHVAFDSDNQRFLAASANAVCIWENAFEHDAFGPLYPIQTIRSETTSLFFEAAVAIFVPSKNQVLTAFAESPVTLWEFSENGETASQIREFHQFGVVNDIAYSPGSQKLVTAGNNDKATVWDIASNELPLQFDLHDDDVTSVVFAPDGDRILSGSLDGTAILWDSATGMKVREPFSSPGTSVLSVAVSNDGQFLAIGLSDGRIRVFSNKEF